MANSTLKVTVDGELNTIDISKLTFAEGRAIEKVTGKEFGEAIKSRSLTVVQALIWVTVKRHKPGTLFSDFDDRAIADIEFEFEKDPEPEADNPTEPAAD